MPLFRWSKQHIILPPTTTDENDNLTACITVACQKMSFPCLSSRRFFGKPLVRASAACPPQWYYRNCKIAPLWTTINSITFRVHLPLHDGKSYLLHTFTSLPYPIKQGFKAILQVRRKIAYSSSSGSLFEPMLCTGTKDRICRGGPLFRAANFRCERALLSGDRSAHGKCATKLFPSLKKKLLGFTLYPRLPWKLSYTVTLNEKRTLT